MSPDIAMCSGGVCSIKETCYRYNANPSRFQSYMEYPKIKDDKEECDSYWKREKK